VCERERADIGEGVEVVVDEERRVRPQVRLQPTPYPGQLTPYPGQLTPYPANRRPILATYIGEGVEVVVDEERFGQKGLYLVQEG